MPKAPTIIRETKRTHAVDVIASGRTSGGGNYLLRAAKVAAKEHSRHVYIGVSPGEKQSEVAHAIKQQYLDMCQVADIHFTMTIVKQTDDY